ncbi:MAG: RsmE family RNA methyltransferase [Calditrichaeota bacterium]|nr:RsmE family RNA methyltransferase [Candidatus Cloacimonadota bacterium]MCB1045965.1 RsmE family RNA methyltransferase [Calditrichota bacterium]
MNRVPFVLLDHLPDPGHRFQPDRNQLHHLLRVLRLKQGQELRLLDGRGHSALASLQLAGSHAELLVESVDTLPGPFPELEAWLPVIRESRLEVAVEKLVELGVSRLRLYTSERTGDKGRTPDIRRLERIRQAAMEQCGLAWTPPLDGPLSLNELLAHERLPLLLADPEPFGDLPRPTHDAPGLALLAGPEGGFSPGERETLRARAQCAISFGPTILRAETALLALAVRVRSTP